MVRISRLIPGRGDVNSFFGLMLDNVADLILTVSLLQAAFGFPATFAMTHMIPGTALGVLLGDLGFYILAKRLARRTGRSDVTAMPLGLDTPSSFGMALLVIGPAFAHAKTNLGLAEYDAATYAWHIGIGAIFVSGLLKLAVAPVASWVREVVPRAGLLGSLAAVALVLIGFLPLMEVMAVPLVGLFCFWLIQTNLLGRVALPGGVPGTLAALLLGSALVYGFLGLDVWNGSPPGPTPGPPASTPVFFPTDWLQALTFGWVARLPDLVSYLPVVLPFALVTVLGGIDCTESAAAVGDEYDTRVVVGIEGAATLIAALCGGVIQTTPYIGHPAYKAMGGRTAYVLAVAIFVGAAGLIGFFQIIFDVVPKVTVFPILIFIGLEITAQSFFATKEKHYGALALACLPAMAKVVAILMAGVLAELTISGKITGPLDFSERTRDMLIVLRTMSGGFVLTSLLWASVMAAILDRKFNQAAAFLVVCAVACLFGLMHSPLPDDQAFLPSWPTAEVSPAPPVDGEAPQAVTDAGPDHAESGHAEEEHTKNDHAADVALDGPFLVGPEHLTTLPWRFAGGYLLVAAMIVLWGAWRRWQNVPDTDFGEISHEFGTGALREPGTPEEQDNPSAAPSPATDDANATPPPNNRMGPPETP